MTTPKQLEANNTRQHHLATDLMNEVDALKDEAARAREEQREACARALDPETTLKGEWFAARVRATPLDATPLADRIKELDTLLEGQRAFTAANRLEADIECDRAEKAEKRAAELEALLQEKVLNATTARDENSALRMERDSLLRAASGTSHAAVSLELSQLRDELAALREERDALKAALKAEADAALKAQLSEVSLRDELTALRPQLADADLFLTALRRTEP